MNAKLKVFEEALLGQELERDSKFPSLEVPRIKNKERTSDRVNFSPTTNPPPKDYWSCPGCTQESLSALGQLKPLLPSAVPKRQDPPSDREKQDTPYNRQSVITSTPLIDATRSQLIKTLISVSQQNFRLNATRGPHTISPMEGSIYSYDERRQRISRPRDEIHA